VARLVELAWSRGAEAALADYAALPAARRSAALLLSVADQLLWTGKAVEAASLLERAAADAPLLAEARFQQGRAALQRAEVTQALAAFRSGLAVIDRDTSLGAAARAALRRRLEHRVAFLTRAEELLSRSGGYRSPEGRLFLFKFDPYLNTFPALLEPATGTVRVLYPSAGGGLEWQDEGGRPVGSLTFAGGSGNEAGLVLRDSTGETRATGLGLAQETLGYEAAGARIEGTLFRPRGRGPLPAVVLTHGAGLSTRYNLALEAAAYASAGIAAFVYDKPGLGRSRGANWLLLSIEDQVAYVAAAVERLRSRSDIGAVGVWGFSQGGWVAPLVAARAKDVAFVVIASGAAVSPQEQYTQAIALRLRAAGVSGDGVEAALHHLREVWSKVNAGARLGDLGDLYARAAAAPWGAQLPRLGFQWEVDWWRENEVDAAIALRSLRVPLLALFGEKDETVPARENVPLLASHLAASATGDYTITVLPGANHQMRTGNDYQARYFPSMVDWVAARFGEARYRVPRQPAARRPGSRRRRPRAVSAARRRRAGCGRGPDGRADARWPRRPRCGAYGGCRRADSPRAARDRPTCRPPPSLAPPPDPGPAPG
jgi:dienelactone hydrolase